ncbi:hypothetical protein NL676_007827 [Syzygium grande]|nr:hypothetical protein NL676_007827 [Syzygium grande]
MIVEKNIRWVSGPPACSGSPNHHEARLDRVGGGDSGERFETQPLLGGQRRRRRSGPAGGGRRRRRSELGTQLRRR